MSSGHNSDYEIEGSNSNSEQGQSQATQVANKIKDKATPRAG